MLLPYTSDRPPRNPPFVVLTLVLVHFALFGLFAFLLLRHEGTALAWYANLSLVPGDLRWYSPLTYAFLHGSVLHLSANMAFLWVFGGSVEDALGWKRFLVLYLGAVVLTGLLQAGMAWIGPGAERLTPIVGASGAVAALVGVFAVRFYRSRIRFIGLPWRVPAIMLLALVLLGEMASTLWHVIQRMQGTAAPTTAHWAHLGGFLLGLLWAQATRMMHAGRSEYLTEDARVEMERGSPVAAAHRWEAVLREQPENLEAQAELGRAWGLAGDREQAQARYRPAITGLLKRGDRPEAARRYAELLSFCPEAALDAPEQLAVAGALEEAKDYPAALAALDKLVAAHPAAREAEIALLRSGALLLNRLNAPERAVERLERFLAAYPESDSKPYAESLRRKARGQGAGEEG